MNFGPSSLCSKYQRKAENITWRHLQNVILKVSHLRLPRGMVSRDTRIAGQSHCRLGVAEEME